jgi:SAM-dependent methyltransferase
MRRETTNRIRFVIEDLLPPILRDSRLFLWLAQIAWGKHISDLAAFRENAPFLSEEAYADLYRKHPRVHSGTDNSEACIRKIVEEVEGESVCDIGCGTGALLTRICKGHPNLLRITGVDFVIDDAAALPNVEYIAAKIEQLPFADAEFDTVVCTHVIEHVLDYRRAIMELRRVARKRIIIVVPREREARYTFNPHFNFFPYRHSFLRAMHPVPQHYSCVNVGRDIFYTENVER